MKKPIKIKEPTFKIAWKTADRKLWLQWTGFLREDYPKDLPPITEINTPLECNNEWCGKVLHTGEKVLVEWTTFDHKNTWVFCSVDCQRIYVLAYIKEMGASFIPPGDNPGSEFIEVDL